MKLYLAQMKPLLGNIQKNLEKMCCCIDDAIEQKSDLIVFPELSLTGYALEDLTGEVYIESVPEEILERSKKISILFGAVELGEDKYTYNSSFFVEEGEVIHRHRKVYLPTYGMFDEARYFKAGNSIKAFNSKHGRLGVLICEDMWHQAAPFILAQDGAEQILVLTNSPSRGLLDELTIEKEWNSLLHASAISNLTFVTMVNRVGIEDGLNFWGGSVVYSPTGSKVEVLDKFQELGAVVDIDLRDVRRARNSGPVPKNENLPLIMKELNRIYSK